MMVLMLVVMGYHAWLLTSNVARIMLSYHRLQDVLGHHTVRGRSREEITGVIGACLVLGEVVIVERSCENYVSIAITVDTRCEERLLSSLLWWWV